MISLRQIEVLHAILSTGSVTVAAKALNVSQPAVSKMLQQAERQLGFKLFVRNGNRLSATEEALALYREIEQILPQVDAVQRLAENLRHGTGRILRIVALPSLGQTLLPSALASFKPMHPALDIELRLQHTEELVQALLLRDADLGFDFGGLNHPAIVRKTLVISEYVCIAPAGWFPEGAQGKDAPKIRQSGRPAKAFQPDAFRIAAPASRDPIGREFDRLLAGRSRRRCREHRKSKGTESRHRAWRMAQADIRFGAGFHAGQPCHLAAEIRV